MPDSTADATGRRTVHVECGRSSGALAPAQSIVFDSPTNYELPSSRQEGFVYLDGPWIVQSDALVRPNGATKPSAVVFPYRGTDVDAVMAHGADGASSVTVLRDSYPIADRIKGDDVMVPGRFSIVEVVQPRSYGLVRDPRPDLHELRLETTSPGLQIRMISYARCAPGGD